MPPLQDMTDPPDDDDAAAHSKLPRENEARSKAMIPNAAFDIWLKRGLHQMFDDVAREPIPPELLRLIEQDRKT